VISPADGAGRYQAQNGQIGGKYMASYPLAKEGLFIGMAHAVANMDSNSGKHKLYRGQEDYIYSVAWQSSLGSVMLSVKVAGEPSVIQPGSQVEIEGLSVMEWTNNEGGHGLSFRAAAIRPVTTSRVQRTSAGGDA
jgi:hypothetical protein